MMPILYLPADSVARAVGANEVVVALVTQARERNLPLDLQRTSSRGLYWLEPLLEIDSPQGRLGFGPLTVADVPSLLDALQGDPSTHPLALGPVEQLPYLKTQQRLLFARAGITRPLSLEDYQAHGGFEGLTRAIALGGAGQDRTAAGVVALLAMPLTYAVLTPFSIGLSARRFQILAPLQAEQLDPLSVLD